MKIILISATFLLTNPLLAVAKECMSPDAFAERLLDGEEKNGFWKFPRCAENEHIATARELAEIAMCWGAKGIEEKPEDFEAYEARRRKDFWGYGEYRTALDVENEGIIPPKNFDKFIFSMEGYVPPKGGDENLVVLAQSSDRQKGYDVAFNPYYNGYIYLFGWRSLMPRRQALCLPNRDGVQYKKADVIPTPNVQLFSRRTFDAHV